MTTTDKSTSPVLTRAQRVNQEITERLRARHTLLWIVAPVPEHPRVERAIVDAAAAARFPCLFWDCSTGLSEASGRARTTNTDPAAVLFTIRDSKERTVYVLRHMHRWLADPVMAQSIRSRERELKNGVPATEARAMVILAPTAEGAADLGATVIDYPIPDRVEMARILDGVIAALPEDYRANAAPNGTREAAIDAAVGLMASEAEDCYARSLVRSRTIDPVLVSAEKRRVVAREKVLTWYEPDPRGLDGIGGLDVVKAWCTARKVGFSERARAFGLRAPQGFLLVGVSGCGKSLTPKCVAAAWGVPLLRLDMGALRSKYVGDSEANIRKALQLAETVSPCVLWLDELEKALGGSTGEQGDGGVSADALGAVLTWMQERQGSVFMVATANDVRSLPPELLRKGRFDEVFWVDLPSLPERREIAAVTLRQYGREPETVDLAAVAKATEGFTGSEIAAIVPDALFAAFNDGERALTTADLLTAAGTVVPLAKTAADKIDDLRAWAKGRARPASTPVETAKGTGRALDL